MASVIGIEVREVLETGEYHMYLVYKADGSSTWEALHAFKTGIFDDVLTTVYTLDLSNTSTIAEGDERGGTQAELDARGHEVIATGAQADAFWEIMKDRLPAGRGILPRPECSCKLLSGIR